MPILDRLVGLETEYAVRLPRSDEEAAPPSRFLLYQSLVRRLRREVASAPARHFKEGVFLANGGAVWFEAERPAAGGGLVEGATPECRGPRAAVRYQRAQDELLSRCARSTELDGETAFSLVKNDRDAAGHVYGAQENYEAVLASGLLLWIWRAGLILLVPLLLLTWLGLLVMIAGILLYLALAGLLYLPLQLLVRQPRRLALAFFGRDLVEGRETGGSTPVWLETVLLWLTRIVTGPLAIGLWSLARATAFRRARHQLLPFLVSRAVVTGAGLVDARGRFQLADKAPATNCVVGLGGFLGDRPIFTFGHFFKAICVDTWLSPRSYSDLFAAQQRLQIGLGDSNMADTAEFLKVGTTALVLDAIEAGELPAVGRLRHPIQALHRICADPTLQCRVELADGSRRTALQLQRCYLEACRRYVHRHLDSGQEAHEVLMRWAEVLDALEQVDASQPLPPALVGRLDWVTKKHLLDRAGSDCSWSTRKKIDIRYHELSDDGYFRLLQSAGLTHALIEPDEVEQAIRVPPANSPATMRGHFIREFATDTESHVSVNWKQVVLGRGFRARVIRLARYNQVRPARRPSPDPAETE